MASSSKLHEALMANRPDMFWAFLGMGEFLVICSGSYVAHMWQRRISGRGVLVAGSRFVTVAAEHLLFKGLDRRDPEVGFLRQLDDLAVVNQTSIFRMSLRSQELPWIK